MTTSTDNSKNSNITKVTVKTPSPIRTEAVVPIAIIFLAIGLYVHFFFDSHIRKAIEWTSTYIHGAEVNVGSVKTSFLGGSFSLKDLEVTDKEQPARNLIQIGEIKFQFLWDALLRAKFVVEDAGVDNIQIYSPRKTPGYVRPPEPPSDKPSAMAELEKKVLNQTQNEFSGSPIGDLASLLEGSSGDDILKNIQGELKAESTIKALQAELKEKEKLWKERIEKFPKKDEFEALAKRAKELKFNSKDPKQFAADLKEASRIVKEAEQKIDYVKNSSTELKGDINKYNTEFSQIDDLIKQDIKDLEDRLKIPNLDVKDFSKNIFGKMFSDKLVSVQKYMEVGRKYMPPPKDPNEKKAREIIPPPRGSGQNYQFPITTGYPVFWLKVASISSVANEGGFSGNVKGELTNLTSSPEAIGKPAILDLKGDFPNSKIFNTELKITIDHVKIPTESLMLAVGSFPLSDMSLVDSKSLSLKVKSADGSSGLNIKLQEQALDISLKNEFKSVNYDLTAPSKNVSEAVGTVLSKIPVITLNAGASGTWSKLNFFLNSNLGTELSLGFSRYLQAKIDEKKKELRALIDSRISTEREKLTSQYNNLKAKFDSELESKKAEVEKAKDDVKAQTSNKDSAQGAALKSLEEKGKKLLKGFKLKK